jgi:hypothetical protein
MTTTTTTLDDLTGDDEITVMLRFCGSPQLGNEPHAESAVYIGRSGVGADARLTFETRSPHPVGTYRWDAYQFEGHWAYGTSAEELRLLETT